MNDINRKTKHASHDVSPHDWPQGLAAGQRGDKRAYQATLKSIAPWLRKIVLRKIGQEYAEDVLQDTLFAIHKALHTYDPTLPAEPWIYTLFRYKMLEHWRRIKVTHSETTYDDIAFEIKADTQDPSINIDHNRIIHSLPSENAKVIQLTRIEGYSIKETAEKMNKSESWVKIIIHRSLKNLMDEFKEVNK